MNNIPLKNIYLLKNTKPILFFFKSMEDLYINKNDKTFVKTIFKKSDE